MFDNRYNLYYTQNGYLLIVFIFSAPVIGNCETTYSTITLSSAADDEPQTGSIADDGEEETVSGSSGLEGLEGTPEETVSGLSNNIADESLEGSQSASVQLQQVIDLPENQLGLHGGLWPIEGEEEEQYFQRIGCWIQQLPDDNSGNHFLL